MLSKMDHDRLPENLTGSLKTSKTHFSIATGQVIHFLHYQLSQFLQVCHPENDDFIVEFSGLNIFICRQQLLRSI